jgi:hypothetical protein
MKLPHDQPSRGRLRDGIVFALCSGCECLFEVGADCFGLQCVFAIHTKAMGTNVCELRRLHCR